MSEERKPPSPERQDGSSVYKYGGDLHKRFDDESLLQLCLYRLLYAQLLCKVDENGFLPFGHKINAAFMQTGFHSGRIEVNNDQQVEVLKELEAVGLIKCVAFRGWKFFLDGDYHRLW